MAKIQEECIVIKLSKLIKNSDEMGATLIVSPETITTIMSVTQEIVGQDVIVEVECV